MKVLVVGANGQLGREFREIFESGETELGKIDDIYKQADVRYTGVEDLDITNRVQVDEIFKEQFDIVINCSAYTNVAGAESNFDLAYSVNALGVRNLAIACNKTGAKLVHISTDYVFDGNANIPYTEADRVNPQNVYGKTKLAGEEFVRQFCPQSFIVRTSWLYGKYGKNFVFTMLGLGKSKNEINVVSDQVGSPTNANDLCYHILKLARTSEFGTYHITGKGKCSWYEFATAFMDFAKLNCKVNAISAQEYADGVIRPAYSVLDHAMLRLAIGDNMREWKQAVQNFIEGVL